MTAIALIIAGLALVSVPFAYRAGENQGYLEAKREDRPKRDTRGRFAKR